MSADNDPALLAELAELIAALTLRDPVELLADPASPLDLTSLQTVQLIDLIEASLDTVIAADAITRANFQHLHAIARCVAAARGG
jgi:acyl carrier protein